MKLKFTLLLTLFISSSCIASNGVADFMCEQSYSNVVRSYTNIQEQGSSLSSLAKRTLYNTMESEIESCLANCSSSKFKYCNDVARKMEGKK